MGRDIYDWRQFLKGHQMGLANVMIYQRLRRNEDFPQLQNACTAMGNG
jgi:hypothetical protein